MSVFELGRVLGEVHVCGEHAAQVADADLHGHSDGALGRAADVVGVPAGYTWDVWVDSAGD